MEIGWPGTGPVSVIGQTGQMGQVVDWIAAAYNDVQTAHSTWRFLRTDFDFDTIATVNTYTAAAISITDLATWVKESFQIYSAVTDEQYLWFEPWKTFRPVYRFGSNRTQSVRPTVISIKPNNSLILWAIPDDTYTVTGEYYKSSASMATDVAVPNFPDRFHMILVWKALMYYGAFAAAEEKYAQGENEYGRFLRDLEIDQLEKPLYGEPLA